jgi:hypothetical protein
VQTPALTAYLRSAPFSSYAPCDATFPNPRERFHVFSVRHRPPQNIPGRPATSLAATSCRSTRVKVVLGRDEHHAPIGKDVRLSKNVWNPDFAEIGAADVAQCDVEIGDGSRPHAAPCLDPLEARTIDDPLLPTLLAGIRPSAAIRRAVATETSRRVAASSMVRASSLMIDYAHEHSPRSVLPMLTAYPRAVESGSYSWSKCSSEGRLVGAAPWRAH